MEDIYLDEREEFRDSLATVDDRGGRIWIYPKKPSGKYYNYRVWASYLLLVVLFGLPWLKFDGDPLFLFNVVERKFILFGQIFTPQDMHLAALAMITMMLFIVLFTVVFGRLFCGWVCPQTIFMVMVFRRIEYWIEGDASQQKKLNIAPWSGKKFFKKISKHVIFFSISVLIANTFLSYIIGVDKVIEIVTEPVTMHLGGFFAMLVFSGLFYGVFAFFREQVCTVVCPYGRLQGVLLVKESIVVIYDWIRGEPRGRIKKKDPEANKHLGDCVDCGLCVRVCPTGIDIRNGTQLECVNCTACMDACDDIMRKVGKDEGLIRYDSHENIEKGKLKIFTPRVWAYTGILMVLIIFQGFLFTTRTEVETTLLRTPGMLFQEVDENYISNLYNYQLVNKTSDPITNIEFRMQTEGGRIKMVGDAVLDVDKLNSIKGSLFVEMEKSALKGRKNRLIIEVYSNDKKIDALKTNFLGPIQ
ncbi:MAG: cytochrome c oxidase accessory protein CcoG [Saprospiraceae bacterium]|nr:cytochrome c oxidase accessory protein CcoG [Saprospiraceae bacterium]